MDLVLSSLAPKIAVMENNIAWMRGDYGVIHEHGPSNQKTKPPTDKPSEDEGSSDPTSVSPALSCVPAAIPGQNASPGNGTATTTAVQS